MKSLVIPSILCLALVTAPLFLSATNRPATPPTIESRVRHEILMLPYYNVFDDIDYKVEGTKVTLVGDVTWPPVRSDAEAAVKRIAGVTSVDDQIRVLPLSPFDDQIRRAELRAIYSQASLSRYGAGTQPSIRIIVENGNVRLVGVVDNQTDKNLASIRANQVPNVFSVTNQLRVSPQS